MKKDILAAILSISGKKLTDDEKFLFEKHNPAGVTLFGWNIDNKNQIKNLIKEIKEVIGRDDVIISIDQEGGRVRRLTPPEFRPYAAHIEIASLPAKKAIKAARLHTELISSDLHELGINVNFAPCLDILHHDTTEALKSRCFSNDVNITATLGKTMVDTYIKNGIIPCIKHLPGLGSVSGDPHLSLPLTNLSEKDFENELLPFKNCNHSPLAMTAHMIIPFLEKDTPLTQSKKGIKELIRNKIGFEGFLISDAIDMHALSGTLTQKVLKSLEAGCDCICYSLGNIKGLQEVCKACPKLSDEAQQRLDKALQILHNKKEITDIKSKSDEYSKLMGSITPYKESYDATEVLYKLQLKE